MQTTIQSGPSRVAPYGTVDPCNSANVVTSAGLGYVYK